MRDDFPQKVKLDLAKRVAFRCSRPECGATTSGPQEGEGSVNIGVAAHITAASKDGPRYDESLSSDERKSLRNAIWLCQNDAKLIDSDVQKYTVELLQEWKALAESRAADSVGKPEQNKLLENDLKLFQMTVGAYKDKGTPKFFLDSQDLSIEQKADLYDRVYLSEKGKLPKSNPYRNA